MLVQRLLAWIDTAPPDRRAEAASALARAYMHSPLAQPERQLAESAMVVLLEDDCAEVRLALAEALAGNPSAPRHVVMSLAVDTPEVAAPVLARSPVFVDAELVEFVGGGRAEAQIAIACRPAVSAVVAAAIAEVGEADACEVLLANPGADIPADFLHRIAERFGEAAPIRRLLLHHDRLRPRTRVLLIDRLAEAMVTDAAPGALVPAPRLKALSREAADKAVIAYAARAGEADLAEIAETLTAAGRMTTAFLLRATCMGNLSLFAHCLAALTGAPLGRVETALARDRRNVLRALCRRAGLPDIAFGVVAGAVEAWRRLLDEPGSVEPGRLAHLVTRQVLAAYDGGADRRLDPLLVLLRRFAADAARDHARREAVELAEARRQPAPEEAPDAQAPNEAHAAEAPAAEELPQAVVTAFAYFFADEIAELEEELAGSDGEVAAASVTGAGIEAGIGEFEPIAVPGDAANDDRPVPAVRAVDPSLPEFAPGEPAAAMVEKVRLFMRARAAA